MLNGSRIQFIETVLVTTKRFPYSVFCALVACGLAIYKVESSGVDEEILKLLLSVGLGIPLFLAIQLFDESESSANRLRGMLIRISAWGFLAGFFVYALSDNGSSFFLRYAQVSLACHLLVAYAAYLRQGSEQGFWQFNRQLFLRFCLSFLYASVFYLGLALAMLALEELFKIKLHKHIYGELWYVSVLVLQTIHFLAGVPAIDKSLDRDHSYPKALKVFTQYLLLPLVALYSVILYAYFIKIGITRSWPEGYVGWMVVGESVLGVFCLLLLYPLIADAGARGLGWVQRSLYGALLPLLLMLFIAVGKRIQVYGLTERRYILLVLGIWLFVLCFYFLVSKAKNIKVIPVTLTLLALLTSFGPWGPYVLARKSQMGRLETTLRDNGMLIDGKIARPKAEVSQKDVDKIADSLEYIDEAHGAEHLKPWLSEEQWNGVRFAAAERQYSTDDRPPALVMGYLGLKHRPSWERRMAYKEGAEGAQEYIFNAEHERSDCCLSVTGYDWLLDIRDHKDAKVGLKSQATLLADSSIYLTGLKIDTIKIRLLPLANDLYTRYSKDMVTKIPAKELTINGRASGVSYRIILSRLSLKKTAKGLSVSGAWGQVLYTEKR